MNSSALETKTLVSRTTSLELRGYIIRGYRIWGM